MLSEDIVKNYLKKQVSVLHVMFMNSSYTASYTVAIIVSVMSERSSDKFDIWHGAINVMVTSSLKDKVKIKQAFRI